MTGQFQGGKIILDEAVGFIVFRAHQAMQKEMYRQFAILGVELTPEQWVVLVRLWEQDGRTQNELCESTLRDKPTMSRMLGGMEQRGWLERRADAADGRSRLVFLTREGRALEARLVPLVNRIIGKLRRGISAEELEITLRSLRRMSENLAPRE